MIISIRGTTTLIILINLFVHPTVLEAASSTLKIPKSENINDGLTCTEVELFLSPNFHRYELAKVELLVKETESGAAPASTDGEKSATGALTIEIFFDSEYTQPDWRVELNLTE